MVIGGIPIWKKAFLHSWDSRILTLALSESIVEWDGIIEHKFWIGLYGMDVEIILDSICLS